MATPESWENVTPNWGIRYPKPNAPAQKLPDAFNHMGTDLDDALTRGSLPVAPDSGWINLPLLNGWTSASGRTVQYRKIAGIVYMRGRAIGTASSSTTMGTLPAGYRPGQNGRWLTISASGGSAVAVTNVNTTGDIVANQLEPNLESVTFPADG